MGRGRLWKGRGGGSGMRGRNGGGRQGEAGREWQGREKAELGRGGERGSRDRRKKVPDDFGGSVPCRSQTLCSGSLKEISPTQTRSTPILTKFTPEKLCTFCHRTREMGGRERGLRTPWPLAPWIRPQNTACSHGPSTHRTRAHALVFSGGKFPI